MIADSEDCSMKRLRLFVSATPSLEAERKVARTPAARVFLRETRMDWEAFKDPQELGRLVQRTVAEQILEHAQDLSLNLTQLEALSAFLGKLGEEKPEEESEEVVQEAGGVAEGGVIFASGEPPLQTHLPGAGEREARSGGGRCLLGENQLPR